MNWDKFVDNNKYKVKRKFKKSIHTFAAINSKNTPQFKQWAYELYKPYKFTAATTHHSDEYNVVVGLYIVDILNRKYMYAIKINNNVNKTKDQQSKDLSKIKYLSDRGYTVIQITAYNIESFNNAIQKTLSLRK